MLKYRRQTHFLPVRTGRDFKGEYAETKTETTQRKNDAAGN